MGCRYQTLRPCVPITVDSALVCVKDGFQSTAVPHAELLYEREKKRGPCSFSRFIPAWSLVSSLILHAAALRIDDEHVLWSPFFFFFVQLMMEKRIVLSQVEDDH